MRRLWVFFWCVGAVPASAQVCGNGVLEGDEYCEVDPRGGYYFNVSGLDCRDLGFDYCTLGCVGCEMHAPDGAPLGRDTLRPMSEGYIHGYSEEERRRLVAQAELWRERFLVPGLDYRAGEKLLEIGCGVGAVLAVLGEHFPGLNLTGVDLVPSQIAAAKDELASRGLRADLRVADAGALPFDDASFDHVYGVWVLEHVREPHPILREVRRVLRPGGTVAFHETDYAMFHVFPDHPDVAYLGEAQRALFRREGDPHVARALGARLVATGFEDVTSGPMGFHYFTGDPELARFTDYLLGFLEPMVPRLAELGFDEARLREGVAAMRALPSLPEASITQFAFRATARAPR
ncbi:MAG: class I SAM-dependent methyltransferase [Sandaracinus sp.]|nr:class I SAM-dependent methyltransferase [Sandaracinus sp.]MCB9617988.1 class I SAM-dependent methyltransferase [Sandaracinus sp.]MCB9635201.1 class I SAM-dependent methyltransferase [Sandaracinus sp.]